MRILNFTRRKATLSHDEARGLTAAFIDGATEPAQERQLYDYYASGRVADDLRRYADMFAMYSSLTASTARTKAPHRTVWTAAASVAVVAALGAAFLFGDSHTDSDSLYAGSYIIRDGIKITDLKTIMPMLRSAQHYVDSTMRQVDMLYPDDYEAAVIEKALAGISDPQLKEELLANI